MIIIIVISYLFIMIQLHHCCLRIYIVLCTCYDNFSSYSLISKFTCRTRDSLEGMVCERIKYNVLDAFIYIIEIIIIMGSISILEYISTCNYYSTGSIQLCGINAKRHLTW